MSCSWYSNHVDWQTSQSSNFNDTQIILLLEKRSSLIYFDCMQGEFCSLCRCVFQRIWWSGEVLVHFQCAQYICNYRIWFWLFSTSTMLPALRKLYSWKLNYRALYCWPPCLASAFGSCGAVQENISGSFTLWSLFISC